MNIRKSPLYSIWAGMKSRCYSKTNATYHNYGGRGIIVCERWRTSYANFLEDMSPRPSLKHSLDRIDPDGNYEPSNCRWATQDIQGYNRSKKRMVTIEGIEYRAIDLAKKAGKKLTTIIERAERGLDMESVMREERNFELKEENRLKMVDGFRKARASETHCLNGHEWTPETTRILSNTGNRRCLICLRAAEKRTSERRSRERREAKMKCEAA